LSSEPTYVAEDDPGFPTPLYAHATSCEPLKAEGVSGAAVERLTMPDGRRLVAKHLTPIADWMMRATEDAGRAATLWTTGAMDALPQSVDDAMVRVERADDEGWWIYLRDVSDWFATAGTRFPRADGQRILAALADLQEGFWNRRVSGACRLERLLQLCAPAVITRALPQTDPFRAHVVRGWTLFAKTAPAPVRNGVFELLDDPQPLADALRSEGTTLVHGDPHLGNVVLGPKKVVLLDWSLATLAPAAVDFVWFLDHSLHLFDAEADELIDDFRRFEGERHSERILELAYLAEVVTGGWDFAEPFEGDARRTRAAWWVERAREALNRWL
jgi:hypothetical protein